MSYVTNLILTVNDDDPDKKVACLNHYLVSTKKHKDGLLRIQKESCVGDKCLEVAVYVGAFNYLDQKGFDEFFFSIYWDECVLTRREQSYSMQTVTVRDGVRQ